MSTFIIAIAGAADNGNFYFTVDLDGIDYQITFLFNEREGFWYFDLADTEGNKIRSGVKCVVNFPLLRLLKSLGRPPGELLVLNTQTVPTDPGLADLGVGSVLAYAEEAS